MTPRLLFLFFFILMPVRVWSQSLYSRSATPIWARGPVTISAPDGKKAIVVKHSFPSEVLIRVGKRQYSTGVGLNAEAAWAPDSKAFFVTYSDAGSIGTYHVLVVYVTDAGIRVIEPVPDGSRLFKPTCFDPEPPNVGAIGWMGSGSNLLAIAVEVPPHSSCASMGTFKAYAIQLPSGKVVSTYRQIKAKRAFSKLIGAELRGADDQCVDKPQSCIPCGMKGGDCGQ